MTRLPLAVALVLAAPGCVVYRSAAPLPATPGEEGRPVEPVPPGTVRVDLVSASADRRWDVYYDDQVICTTPCTRWLDPTRPVALRTRDDGWGGKPDLLRLPNLGPAARGGGAVSLVATPTRRGRLATGITFTSLGGMAAITGITLAAVGCTDPDHGGMCTAGGISFFAGAFAVAGGIMMILDSAPHADVLEAGTVSSAAGEGPAVSFGPGFVAGRF